MYQVEIVWNREFHYISYGTPFKKLEDAKNYAKYSKDMRDGARVKKAQIINVETGEIIFQNYQI